MARSVSGETVPADGPEASRWKDCARRALHALLLGAAYYAGSILGYALVFPATGFSIIWPPNTILLAALLVVSRRRWPELLLIAFPVHELVQMQFGVSLSAAALSYVYDCVLVVLTALALRRFRIGDLALGSLREALIFLAVTTASVALASLVWSPLIVSVWIGGDLSQQFGLVFLSNYLPFLIALPGFVTGLRRGPELMRSTTLARHAEFMILVLGLLGCGIGAFGLSRGAPGNSPALFYAPLPFLLWAAVRMGPGGLSFCFLIFALTATFNAVATYGPFVTASADENVLRLQIFLLALYIPLLVLASVVRERRSKEEALRRSEMRYRDVVESQSDLVCRFLPDATLTFVNEAYCRHFSRSREQLIGKPFIDLIPAASREAVWKEIELLEESRKEHTHEHEVILPDGRTGWHSWTNYGIAGVSGRIEEFQGIGRDITKRKLAELALRESEARIELAAGTLNLGFWIWNPVTNHVWASKTMGRTLGLSSEGVTTYEKFLEYVLPEDRPFIETAVQHAMSRLADLEVEYRVRQPDGGVRWIDSRGRCQLDSTGKFKEIAGMSIDITAQKQAELQMRSQLEELTHISRLAVVGELTASIAHEINQPLGAILSNAEAAELLLESPAPALDPVREILADIRADDARATEIVKRLRTLLRKRELEMQPLDLNELIGETLRMVAFDARRRGVELIAELTSELPKAHGDKLHLQQVLLNLLLNGMDAMTGVPETQRRLSVRSLSDGNGFVGCVVADSGPGIPEERLPKLFDSFFTTKTNGVGLGLSIARSIVEAHHGRLWAENNHCGSGGAAFYVLVRAALSTGPV